jgi:FtsZ-binding cell division protein ZapB
LLDQELSEKSLQLESSPTEEKMKISEQVQALQRERDQLQRQRNSVDERLKHGRVLSPKVSQYSLELELLYEDE